MAQNLLSRWFRRSDEVSRAWTVSDYIRMITASGLLGYSAPTTFTAGGRPTERLQATFQSYAQDIYAAHPIIFGLMQRRASVFSEARFCWRAVKNGNPGDVLPINDGLDLLENPWPGATTGTLLTRMRQDADLGGTAYVVRQKGRDGKERLRRLRPDWVQIVLTGDPYTEVDVDLVGIVYAPNGPDNSPVEAFLPDEFAMWAPIPDPLAQFRGMSWLTPVLREIEADNSATEHKRSFLKNGAVLGPIIKAPPGLSVDQFKRFIEAADSAHAGPTNAGKFLFLASGSEVSTVAANLQQVDFKAITGLSETRLAVAAGIPAVIAGISEGLQGSSLNAGNYNAAKRAWIDGGLRPDWRSVCEALQSITPPPDLSGLDLEPGVEAQLWILESDIALLHEDRLDAAQVRQANATTINTLVTAGFVPDSIVVAVRDDDLSALKHSGLTSVQLAPPGQGDPNAAADTSGYGDQTGSSPDASYEQALAEAARSGALAAVDLLRSQGLLPDVQRASGDWSRHPHPGQRYRHGWIPLAAPDLNADVPGASVAGVVAELDVLPLDEHAWLAKLLQGGPYNPAAQFPPLEHEVRAQAEAELDSLVARGLVSKGANGAYRITAKGKAAKAASRAARVRAAQLADLTGDTGPATARLRALAVRTPTSERSLSGGKWGEVKLLDFGDATAVEKRYPRLSGQVLQDVIDAEVLAPEVFRALGLRSPAVIDDGTGRLLMQYADEQPWALRRGSVMGEDLESEEGRLFGLADHLIANRDRNGGNWMISWDEHLIAIDHGGAFRIRTAGDLGPFVDYLQGSRPITELSKAQVAKVRAAIEALRSKFEARGRSAWFRAMMDRLDAVERRLQ